MFPEGPVNGHRDQPPEYENRGPDGWRFARVQWPKTIQASRKTHYFERGVCLCGKHTDGANGWFLNRTDYPASILNAEALKCNKCKKALEAR